MREKPERLPVPCAQPNPIFRAPLAASQKHLKLNKHFNRPHSEPGFLRETAGPTVTCEEPTALSPGVPRG